MNGNTLKWGQLTQALAKDEATIIVDYRNLYLRNKDINIYDLKRIIEELSRFKETILYEYQQEDALSKIDMKVKNLISDTTIISNYERITKAYIKQQKELAFDKKSPKITGTENVSTILESIRQYNKSSECDVSTKEFIDSTIAHKIKTLSNLRTCIEAYGLHEFIVNRGEEYILYNICISYTTRKGKEKKDALVLLKRDNLLEQYVNPYLNKHSIMFNGIKIKYEDINVIRVSRCLYNKDEAPLFFKKATFGMESFQINRSYSRIKLYEFCENVTDRFINTTSAKINRGTHDYIFRERLLELENINNINFDLTKLIQLCQELNIANEKGLLFAKAALVRAICDHVPPIFMLDNFENVAANYKAEKNSRSFKNAIKRLNDFYKPVASGGLHSQIRKKESLPTHEQLDVSKELDYLLQEVCRLLK